MCCQCLCGVRDQRSGPQPLCDWSCSQTQERTRHVPSLPSSRADAREPTTTSKRGNTKNCDTGSTVLTMTRIATFTAGPANMRKQLKYASCGRRVPHLCVDVRIVWTPFFCVHESPNTHRFQNYLTNESMALLRLLPNRRVIQSRSDVPICPHQRMVELTYSSWIAHT